MDDLRQASAAAAGAELDPDELSQEEHDYLVQLCGHAVAPPRPAATEVLDAFRPDLRDYPSIVAALRKDLVQNIAAINEAARVAPKKTIEDIDYVHQSYVDGYKDALYEILVLLNKLEAQ